MIIMCAPEDQDIIPTLPESQTLAQNILHVQGLQRCEWYKTVI